MKFLLVAMMLIPALASADTSTTNFGFIIPSTGSLNWAPKVEDWMVKIDTGVPGLKHESTFTSPTNWSGSSITLTGANGYITSGSSVTAGAFFGGNAVIGNMTVGLGASSVYSNTAYGYQVLGLNQSLGSGNVGVGYQSLFSNTTGILNVAVGSQALYSNTYGGSNTAVGEVAMFSNTTGIENSAFGGGALQANTTGQDNVAIGVWSLHANTSGTTNAALGVEALVTNTQGSYNTALGNGALYSNTTASGNTAVGRAALFANSTGTANVALGYEALSANTTGSQNVALGYNAMLTNTGGGNNVAVGLDSLYDNTQGWFNTALGQGAGYNGGVPLANGSRNTYLGAGANSSADGYLNSTALGYGAQITASNQMVFGDANVTANIFHGDLSAPTGHFTAAGIDLSAANGNVNVSASATDGLIAGQAGNAGGVDIAGGTQYNTGGFLEINGTSRLTNPDAVTIYNDGFIQRFRVAHGGDIQFGYGNAQSTITAAGDIQVPGAASIGGNTYFSPNTLTTSTMTATGNLALAGTLTVGGITQSSGYAPIFGSSIAANAESIASTSYVGVATMTWTSLKGSRPAYAQVHFHINNSAGLSRNYTYIVTLNGAALEGTNTITSSGNSTILVDEPYYIPSTTTGTNTIVLNILSSSATGAQTASDTKIFGMEY